MKKILSFTIIALLMQMLFVNQTFATTKEAKFIEKVKTGVTKLGTGPEAKIKVKLKDKTKIEGYITESNENQFVVMNSKTGQPVQVSYSNVKQVKGNNLSTGVKIIIGIAIVFAVILVVTVIAGSQLK